MNDPFEEIENELRKLRPGEPRERLTQRLGRELDASQTPASRGRWQFPAWRWAAWATVGVCCLGGAIAWRGWRHEAPPRTAAALS